MKSHRKHSAPKKITTQCYDVDNVDNKAFAVATTAEDGGTVDEAVECQLHANNERSTTDLNHNTSGTKMAGCQNMEQSVEGDSEFSRRKNNDDDNNVSEMKTDDDVEKLANSATNDMSAADQNQASENQLFSAAVVFDSDDDERRESGRCCLLMQQIKKRSDNNSHDYYCDEEVKGAEKEEDGERYANEGEEDEEEGSKCDGDAAFLSPTGQSPAAPVDESNSCKDYGASFADDEGDGGDPCVLEVVCGGNRALFYPSRWEYGGKGPCVLYDDRWLTPNEFQLLSGRRSAKDWKRSIKHHGTSLKALLASRRLQFEPPAPCRCDKCVKDRGGVGEKLTPFNRPLADVIGQTKRSSESVKKKSSCSKKKRGAYKADDTMVHFGDENELADSGNWCAEVASCQDGQGVTHNTLKLKIVRSSPDANVKPQHYNSSSDNSFIVPRLQADETSDENYNLLIESQQLQHQQQKRRRVREKNATGRRMRDDAELFNLLNRVRSTMTSSHEDLSPPLDKAEECSAGDLYEGWGLDLSSGKNGWKESALTKKKSQLKGSHSGRSLLLNSNHRFSNDSESDNGSFRDSKNGRKVVKLEDSRLKNCKSPSNSTTCSDQDETLTVDKRIKDEYFYDRKSTDGISQLSPNSVTSNLSTNSIANNTAIKSNSNTGSKSAENEKDSRLIKIIHELRNYKTQLIRNIEHTKKLTNHVRTASSSVTNAKATLVETSSAAAKACRQQHSSSSSTSAASGHRQSMSTVHHFPSLARLNNTLHHTVGLMCSSSSSSSADLVDSTATMAPHLSHARSMTAALPHSVAGSKRALAATAPFDADGHPASKKRPKTPTTSGSGGGRRQLQSLLRHSASVPVATVSPTTRRYVMNASAINDCTGASAAARCHQQQQLQQQQQGGSTTTTVAKMAKYFSSIINDDENWLVDFTKQRQEMTSTSPNSGMLTPQACSIRPSSASPFAVDQFGVLDLSCRGGKSLSCSPSRDNVSPFDRSAISVVSSLEFVDVNYAAPLDLSKNTSLAEEVATL